MDDDALTLPVDTTTDAPSDDDDDATAIPAVASADA